jgi:hypothetical protein
MSPDPAPARTGHDVFFAHAEPDRARVLPLLTALRGRGLRVFTADDTPLGATWDTFLPAQQRRSRATVACISAAYVDAFYQRAEVHDAIALARRSAHRVIPVWLDPPGRDDVLYGLRLLQGILLPEHGPEEVARRVAASLGAEVDAPPAPARPAGLLDALLRLSPASFEELIERTGLPRQRLLPASVEQARRAINLIAHAEEADADVLVETLRRMRPGIV